MPAFLLSLREGLEAALIVGIVLGTLRKLGRPGDARFVWMGVAAASVLSLLVAAALSAAGANFEGRAAQLFEGITMLLAAGILTWMILWMQRQGTGLQQRLSSDVRATARDPRGTALSLFSVAFLAVFREGIELALFLVATVFTTSTSATIVGAVIGLAAAVAFGALLYRGMVRLNLGRFFQVTSLLLIVFAAGMVAYGFHELIEAGVVPAVLDPIYNINPVLSDKSTAGLILKALVGYNGNPALTESIAYLLYFMVIWLAVRVVRQEREPAHQTA